MKFSNVRLVMLVSLLIAGISSLAAQSTDASPVAQNLLVSADWNCFRANSEHDFIEFSAAIGREGLNYILQDGKYVADFVVDAALMQNDSTVSRKVWRNTNQVDSLTDINASQQLYVLNSFFAKPGTYQLLLNVYDVSDSSRVTKINMDVNAYELSFSPAMSDVQIAASIARDDTDNIFTKNGYKVLPNPTAVFGLGLPILYTYTEFYNLSDGTSEEGKKYTVNYKIYDNDGSLAKEYPAKVRVKPGASAVDVNNLNVVTLRSGPYTLEVSLTDEESGITVNRQRRFYVYRESDYSEENIAQQQKVAEEMVGEGSAGLDADRYDLLTEEELDQEFEYARYISSNRERRTWKSLNIEGKRNYIKEFWAAHDDTPGTPANEYKQQYLERVKLANTLYRGNFKEGWTTDRGRILLVYGKPDDIERYPQSGENREYSRWLYFNLQGGVEFIFVDKHGMSDQELVHSSARGELYDTEWVRWIDPNM